MKYYRLLCWIPAATWLYARAVVDRYDGWGAWAAAPLLLVPVAISAFFAGVGLLIVGRMKSGRPTGWDWIAIGVAGLPVLWIAFRLVVSWVQPS
jgi:hypothetical protein